VLTLRDWKSERSFLALWLLAGLAWWTTIMARDVFFDSVPCILRSEFFHWAFGFGLFPMTLLLLLKKFSPSPAAVSMQFLSFSLKCLFGAYVGLIFVHYGAYQPGFDCRSDNDNAFRISFVSHAVVCLALFTGYFFKLRNDGSLHSVTVPAQEDGYAEALLANAQLERVFRHKHALIWASWMAVVCWCYLFVNVHIGIFAVSDQALLLTELWAMVVLVHGGFMAWTYRRLWHQFFVEEEENESDEKDFGLLGCIV